MFTCQKIKVFSLTFLSFLVLNVLLSGTTETKEKRKVLLLQIIEENWDNLEFVPPLRDIASNYKPPTKKEVMERMIKEWEKLATKDRILKIIKHFMSKGHIPKNAKLVTHHQIRYFGKIEELSDNEIFDVGRYRFGEIFFVYSYNRIPEKISLLTDPSDEPFVWGGMYYFGYIRLVDDLYIVSSDDVGNLKIKYNEKSYDLKVGRKIQIPLKTKKMTKKDMVNFKENYEKVWDNPDKKIRDSTRIISIKKEVFEFKTKITIINHGYIEIEI